MAPLAEFRGQMVGGEASPVAVQAERIRAARATVGADFFINAAPTSSSRPVGPDDSKVDKRRARHRLCRRRRQGFFAPGLADLRMLERLCAASPLPVNSWRGPERRPRPTSPPPASPISHSPFPYKLAMSPGRRCRRDLIQARAAISRRSDQSEAVGGR